jgi:NADH-quinone oxidoreductase subunit E
MAQLDVGERRPRKHIYRGDVLVEPPPPEVEAVVARHASSRDGLVTVLQEIQTLFGYLPERHLRYAARGLGLPLSRVCGVASFYSQFRFSPSGEYVIRTCRGTACHVGESKAILTALKTHLNIGEDQTTTDGKFTLQTVACMGCCSLAPVLTINGGTFGKITPESAVDTIEKVRAGRLEIKT